MTLDNSLKQWFIALTDDPNDQSAIAIYLMRFRARVGFTRRRMLPAGKAQCLYCDDTINYGSRGCLALVEHATKGKKHAEKDALRRTNYSLGSWLRFPRRLLPVSMPVNGVPSLLMHQMALLRNYAIPCWFHCLRLCCHCHFVNRCTILKR